MMQSVRFKLQLIKQEGSYLFTKSKELTFTSRNLLVSLKFFMFPRKLGRNIELFLCKNLGLNLDFPF